MLDSQKNETEQRMTLLQSGVQRQHGYLGSLAAVAFLVGHNQTAQELKCEVLVRRTGPICLHSRWRDSFCSGLGGDRDWEKSQQATRSQWN